MVSISAYVIGRGQPCDTFPGKTSTGVQVNLQTAAVDPRIFRLGTSLRIPGKGLYLAQDTGSAIVGTRIDLAMKTCREAYNWGRRSLVISYKV